MRYVVTTAQWVMDQVRLQHGATDCSDLIFCSGRHYLLTRWWLASLGGGKEGIAHSPSILMPCDCKTARVCSETVYAPCAVDARKRYCSLTQ